MVRFFISPGYTGVSLQGLEEKRRRTGTSSSSVRRSSYLIPATLLRTMSETPFGNGA
jgi:hypothetical protein